MARGYAKVRGGTNEFYPAWRRAGDMGLDQAAGEAYNRANRKPAGTVGLTGYDAAAGGDYWVPIVGVADVHDETGTRSMIVRDSIPRETAVTGPDGRVLEVQLANVYRDATDAEIAADATRVVGEVQADTRLMTIVGMLVAEFNVVRAALPTPLAPITLADKIAQAQAIAVAQREAPPA